MILERPFRDFPLKGIYGPVSEDGVEIFIEEPELREGSLGPEMNFRKQPTVKTSREDKTLPFVRVPKGEMVLYFAKANEEELRILKEKIREPSKEDIEKIRKLYSKSDIISLFLELPQCISLISSEEPLEAEIDGFLLRLGGRYPEGYLYPKRRFVPETIRIAGKKPQRIFYLSVRVRDPKSHIDAVLMAVVIFAERWSIVPVAVKYRNGKVISCIEKPMFALKSPDDKPPIVLEIWDGERKTFKLAPQETEVEIVQHESKGIYIGLDDIVSALRREDAIPHLLGLDPRKFIYPSGNVRGPAIEFSFGKINKKAFLRFLNEYIEFIRGSDHSEYIVFSFLDSSDELQMFLSMAREGQQNRNRLITLMEDLGHPTKVSGTFLFREYNILVTQEPKAVFSVAKLSGNIAEETAEILKELPTGYYVQVNRKYLDFGPQVYSSKGFGETLGIVKDQKK